jgi:YidC/Oxa1 family membrane protein insertase
LTPGIRINVPEPPTKPSKGFGFLSGGPPIEQVTPLYRIATTVERAQNVKKLGIFQEQVGDISWVGLEDRYFLRAILARSVSNQNTVAYGKKGEWIYAEFRYPPATVGAGEEREFPFTFYLGPKDPTYLNQFVALDLGKAIDYGWFGLVARPILQALKFFNSFLKNWGLAIILLTIIIKLLLHPLTRKSMASMKGMQALQPQLKGIREKYKDDKERLNMETMNLFRRHKVNPMGGCLPMLLQMPIYIALYKVLYNATELYHAPFIWFYRDLSAPDPYFILPILLGIAMVAQQKMTPSTGDATQQKMMMLMPIMFTVFMLFLPVGLVLYIFVNTLMTVVQQYMHQKDISFMGLIKGRKA